MQVMRTPTLLLVLVCACLTGCSGNDADDNPNRGGAAGDGGQSHAGGSGIGGSGGANSSEGSGGGGNGTTNTGTETGAGGSGGAGGSTATGGSGGAGGTGSGGTGSGGAAAPGGFSELVSKDVYEQMFLHRNALYAYDDLVAAAGAYPAFCNEGSLDERKREAAAFLANISHETTGGWPAAPDGPDAWGLYFTQEVGCENGACTGYCDAGNLQYPCAVGKTYHGRGPIQLSWNYNYGQAGDALGLPLLADPDLVTSSGTIAFETGLWFWSTPQPPKPSCHDIMTGQWSPSAQDLAAGRKPGFGMTINVINGGLECGFPTNAKVEDRVGFYERYAQILGVDPGPNVYCNEMSSY
jgi:chitinase